MSSQSETSLCNLSLLALGIQSQISNLNEGSPQSNACSTLFSFVYEQLARTARWGCLNKQFSITLIQAASGTPENPLGTTLPIPQQPWLYGYLYPSDCLMMRFLQPPVIATPGSAIPQTTVANSVTPFVAGEYQIPYIIGYSTDSQNNPLQVILTNQESAVANYTVNQQNPQSWDSLFTSAFVASLAAYLVPALSLDKQLQTLQISVAERLILQARAADGNENPISQDHIPDWIQARRGGCADSWRGGIGYNGYGNIAMPWGC